MTGHEQPVAADAWGEFVGSAAEASDRARRVQSTHLAQMGVYQMGAHKMPEIGVSEADVSLRRIQARCAVLTGC